jgi:hypothetical protein
MKQSVLLMAILAWSVAGCSHTVRETKETVVEQPVVTKEHRETIIEKPIVTHEKEVIVERPVPPLRSCSYMSSTYSDGSVACQSGSEFRCVDGSWTGLGLAC